MATDKEGLSQHTKTHARSVTDYSNCGWKCNFIKMCVAANTPDSDFKAPRLMDLINSWAPFIVFGSEVTTSTWRRLLTVYFFLFWFPWSAANGHLKCCSRCYAPGEKKRSGRKTNWWNLKLCNMKSILDGFLRDYLSLSNSSVTQ